MSGLLYFGYVLLSMATINEVYTRFRQLDLRAQVPIIIELTSDQIIALNQSQLYTQALDSFGQSLGGYYQASYEEMKSIMNPQLGGLVDLYLTGDFYGGFYVKVEKSVFEIGSNDPKSGDLQSKYGKAIFGLTDESRAIYTIGVFFNALKNYIEGITKIQMQ